MYLSDAGDIKDLLHHQLFSFNSETYLCLTVNNIFDCLYLVVIYKFSQQSYKLSFFHKKTNLKHVCVLAVGTYVFQKSNFQIVAVYHMQADTKRAI